MVQKHIARIENSFVIDAHYKLSVVEQKIVLYLISKINPKSQELGTSLYFQIPLVELEKILLCDRGKKMASLKSYMKILIEKLSARRIYPAKNSKIGNHIVTGGYIKWFQSILLLEDEYGQTFVEFMFANRMLPFIIQLSQYVQLNVLEVMSMTKVHAIRMYQVFKSEREKHRGRKDICLVKYNLDDLRLLLGLSNKYKETKSFKRNVIDVIKNDINKHSSEIHIEYKLIRKGRKINAVEFSVSDNENYIFSGGSKANNPTKEIKAPSPTHTPTTKDLSRLTFAQTKAYNKLVEFGVNEGIAVKQIIPSIGAMEVNGYEDKFIEYSLVFFTRKARKADAATFVNWWVKKKAFSLDGVNSSYSAIAEKVNEYKKGLVGENRINREIAKNMTDSEFKAWYQSKKQSGQQNTVTPTSIHKRTGATSMAATIEKAIPKRQTTVVGDDAVDAWISNNADQWQEIFNEFNTIFAGASDAAILGAARNKVREIIKNYT